MVNGSGGIVYLITPNENCLSYLVSFNPTSTAGGTSISGTGTMDNQRIYEGVATELSANTYTAPTGYSFNGWNTSQDGTGTHYDDEESVTDLTTVGQTITLYAEWQQDTPPPATIYMQNMRDSNCVTSTPTTVVDIRDNEEYQVQRLADGKCWMLDNLRLGDDTDTYSLTSENTHIDNNFTLPASSTMPAKADYIAAINTDDRDTTVTTTYGVGSSKVGTYYNFCAASGGTQCDDTTTGDATYDICPRYWRLPSGGTTAATSEQQTLASGYNTQADFLAGASIIFSGFLEQSTGSVSNLNTSGYFWSSTDSNSGNKSYAMSPSSSTTTMTSALERNGINVRCLFDPSLIPLADIEVTVTLGEHVTSVTFSTTGETDQTVTNDGTGPGGVATNTVTIKENTSYTISSTYDSGYTIDEWTASNNVTLGSTTTATTTLTAVDDTSGSGTATATLSLTAEEAVPTEYALLYLAGRGTDAPDSDTATSFNDPYTFTITNSTPIYYGYTFTGWSETPVDSANCTNTDGDANCNGTTVDYVSGDTIDVDSTGNTTTKTLYPVYQAVSACPANRICYYDNGADVNGGGRGTMANQSTNSTSVTLIPSNYSRKGYGFAGWVTDGSSSTTPYGPNATITTPSLSSSGLALYAKWIKSTGTLQSWRGCNSMSQNDVIALTDNRNDETYAVAKLANNKCWTIENLRLVPNSVTITDQNTHSPTSSFISEAASSSSSTSLCGIDAGSSGGPECNNQIQFNTNSLDRTLTQSYNTNSDGVAWYSYGVYYNWYTATAGNGTTSISANNTNVAGDICPKNWHLPTSTANGEWVGLNTNYNNGVSNADAGLRNYPVNLIWSGDYNKTSRTGSYENGRYWSATATDATNAYRMGHQVSGSKGAQPRGNYRKWDAFAVRCIRDEVTAEYSDVTVTFPQNVTSITFTNGTDTETATPASPTVSIAQDETYTITANFAPGYELNEWSAGQNSTIDSVSQNPTTITITDDTTLTISVQSIPSYTITVNLGEHVSSIGFYSDGYTPQQVTPATATDNQDGTYTGSVTLYRDVVYTLSSSFDTGNQIDHWTTTSGGTLSNATDPATAYTVTGTATLSLISQERSFTCAKQYRLENADGTYPSTYTADGTESIRSGSICSYTKSVANYTTQSDTATITTDQTISLDLPRDTFALTINKNDSYISSVTGAGTYRWGETVNISATPTLGNRFTSWSQTAGTTSTFGNSSNASTTFTMPIDNATIYADGEAIPTYNVNVTFDEHVSSIGFYNADYGTQQVTPANSTDNQDGTYTGSVTMYDDIEYTLSSSYVTGYEIDHWTTTANGNLGSTTSAATTYTVTGTATLSLTSQLKQPPATCNTPVPNITYMQDITTSNQAAVLASLTTNAAYYLRDSRDLEPYCVSKLQDGNLWLLDNLRLDITDSTILNSLTTTNTNVDSTSLTSLISGNRSAGDQYANGPITAWDSSHTSSYHNRAQANAEYKDTTTTGYGAGSNKIGVYYNYCAASAGSYCYGNGIGDGSPPSNTNATEDLCPANWRIPTGNSSGEYIGIYNIYTNRTATNTNSVQYRLSTPLSGYFHDGSVHNQGTYGYFWSSTYVSSNSMYNLLVEPYYAFPQDYRGRNDGLPMRCILSPTQSTPSHTVTVSLDSGISSVTLTSSLYGTETATSSSPTVTLYDNASYEITATPATGYEFSSWSTTANGTLSSTTTNPTTYTVSDTATLSVTTNDNRILINYNGNGLYYNNDPTDTINQIYYQNTEPTTN